MSGILLATLGGVVTLIAWGTSDYLSGKTGQHTDEYLTNFLVQTVTTLCFVPFLFWYGVPEITLETGAIVALIAFLFTVAYVAFVKALAIGPFGVAAPLANSYALITLLISVVVFQFSPSPLQLAGIIAIVLGAAMLAADRSVFDFRKFKKTTVAFALIAMVTWGIAFALVEPIAKEVFWFHLVFAIGILMPVFGFLYYVWAHRSLPVLSDMAYGKIPHAWWSGVILAVGSLAFFWATESGGSVVIPAVVASASPLVTSLWARIYDAEKLPLYKQLGAIVVVVGLVLLNIQ